MAGESGAGGGARDDTALVVRGSAELATVWLTEVLDSEYAGYEPDTHRIRTLLDERLEDGGGRARGVGGRVRIPVLGVRLAGIPAGIAAAALCATVAVAVTATVANDKPHTAPEAARSHGGLPAATGAPSGADEPSQTGPPASATHSSPAGQGAQTATKPAGPSASPSTAATSAPPPDSGSSLVSAVGAIAPSSNAQWTEEDVHITLQDPVSALQLTIRITPNTGYSKENFWSDHAITAFDVSVNPNAGGLIYTFTLKPGNTIQAGLFTIAAQYQHDSSPHDTSGDTYALSVTTDQAHGSAPAATQGGF
ncbi:MAG TPA: hypothetical protein VFU65_00410 [Actinocrinis sp.]|nr:hypothetical protein [Actinocrinis sp.]